MHSLAPLARAARWSRPLAAIAMVVTLAGPAATAAGQPKPPAGQQFVLSVLSSRPDQVSGGDALVRVDVPRTVPLQQVTVTRNGEDVTAAFAPTPDGRALQGLVSGFKLGRNELAVRAHGEAPGRPDPASLEIVNHPIEGPIFSGQHQQPFVCTTARATFDGRKLLGQPLVDNQDHFGIPVAAETAEGDYPQAPRGYPTAAAEIVGWSANCSADTRYGYVYRSTAGDFHWLD